MHELAWARDDRPVVPDQDPQSISHEITFARNQGSHDVLKGVLLGLCEQVAARMRRHRVLGRIVVLKLRFADFRTITRRHSLGHHTDDAGEIFENAEALLLEGRTASPLSVRLIGVGLAGLIEPEQLPLDLFAAPEADARTSKLNAAVDRLHDRFGDGAVRRARSLVADRTDSTESTLERRD